jgi:hypothetical protein
MAGGNSSSGSDNIFIGKFAGYNETQSNKLYIENSNSSVPLIYGDFLKDSLVINGVLNVRDSLLVNGNLFVAGVAGGNTGWSQYSDATLKTSIVGISNALALTLQLRGVNYKWLDEAKFDSNQHIGFIAQEVNGIIPQVVSNNNGKYTIEYAPLTALLVEAIKEQQAIIESQKLDIENLKAMSAEVKSLKSELEAIKAMLAK